LLPHRVECLERSPELIDLDAHHSQACDLAPNIVEAGLQRPDNFLPRCDIRTLARPAVTRNDLDLLAQVSVRAIEVLPKSAHFSIEQRPPGGELLVRLLDRRGDDIGIAAYGAEPVHYELFYLDRGNALRGARLPAPAVGPVADVVAIPEPPLLAVGGSHGGPAGRAVQDPAEQRRAAGAPRHRASLAQDGVGAVSFFREELERAAKIRGQHAVLAPLIQRLLEEVLFGTAVTLYDPRVLPRLADPDVREHFRGTLLPLLLKRIVHKTERLPEEVPQAVSSWKPYQATHSERRPAKSADKTLFNLVPCNNGLEVAMSQFLDFAQDVKAFAKNAGPQALRIDYLGQTGYRATYTPDFLVRKTDGTYLLVETKGRVDRDVPSKARAAAEWCRAATSNKVHWDYLYVPQEIFAQVGGNSLDVLARTCAPSLAALVREAETAQAVLPFGPRPEERVVKQVKEFIDLGIFETLPSRYQKAIEHAINLFHFHERKEPVSFSPVFQPLLGPIDHAAETLLLKRLADAVPAVAEDQREYFTPNLGATKSKTRDFLTEKCSLLKRLLVHRSPIMPTGLLAFCLDYASKTGDAPPGILMSVRRRFADVAEREFRERLEQVYAFRNTYIAHEKYEPLTSATVARDALKVWLQVLIQLHRAPGREVVQ